MTAREPSWEKNGLPPMANIMQIASAKSRSMRGASQQPDFIGSCLTISHMCLPVYLVVDGLVLVFYGPCDWANGGSVNVFFMVGMVLLMGS